MTSAAELTLAFIRRRPDAAAQVLASMTDKDAAAFINTIPTRYAVAIFQAMNTSASAPIVKLMDTTSATSALRDMEFAAAIAILRGLGPADRIVCMQDMPRSRQREFEKALTFAPDSVGARMTTDIPYLTAARTVDEALQLIKVNKDEGVDSVFVINDQKRYIGTVHVLKLLRCPATARLKDLIDTSCPIVSPNAQLAQVAELGSWHNHRQLPVVTKRGELVGAIGKTLIGQVNSDDTSNGSHQTQSTAGLLMQTMLDCSGGLITLLRQPTSDKDSLGDSNGH